MNHVKTIDVMGYGSFYVEHPGVSVVPTTHIKINKNKAGYLILLLLNSTSKEVIIQKSNTIALGVKSRWKVKQVKNGHDVKLKINQITSDKNEMAPKAPIYKALENTAFIG